MGIVALEYLLKQCPECQGMGKINYEIVSTSSSPNGKMIRIVCPLCSGSGEDPHYKEVKEKGAGDDYPVIER